MDFEISEHDKLVQETAQKFASRTLAKMAAQIERDEKIPDSVLKGLATLGLMGVRAPEEYGGAGASTVAYSLAMNEIANACASTAVTMAVTNMVGEVIAKFGTEAQKQHAIPALCRGDFPGAFALSEPDAGSDPGAMRTTARREGDHWIIDGAKQWITSGDTAGVIVVWARTGGEGTRGISCFLVDGGTPGLKAPRHEDKMGLRGSHTVSLSFENCRVPADSLLGELNGGFKIAMMALDGGRIGIGSQAWGIARGALDEAIRYAKDRQQFGKPIADFQAIQWMIADSETDLAAARLLVLRAASMKDRDVPFSREASMAKLFSSEAAWRVCNRAVQILGGYGYTREFSVERRFRDVRVSQIYEGTSEVQRLVIARSALK